MRRAVLLLMLLAGCQGDRLANEDCVFDADCPTDSACEASECVPTCIEDAECNIAQVCGPGINTVSRICRAPTTFDDSVNNLANNDPPPAAARFAVVVQSTTTADSACGEVLEPGPDIVSISVVDWTGSELAYGQVEFADVAVVGNDFANSSVLDGAPAAVDDATGCPAVFEGNVVSLGCDGHYVVVGFVDTDGDEFALDPSADHDLRVIEWDLQCEVSAPDDLYDVRVCHDTDAAFRGDISSCSSPIITGGFGEQIARLTF